MAAIRQCVRRIHTPGPIRLPRGPVILANSASRWGTFERLSPPSLQFVNVKKWQRREVPSDIERPSYAETGEPNEWETGIPIHDKSSIEKMAAAGDLARRVLDMGGRLCQVCSCPCPTRLHDLSFNIISSQELQRTLSIKFYTLLFSLKALTHPH